MIIIRWLSHIITIVDSVYYENNIFLIQIRHEQGTWDVYVINN